MGLWQTSLGVCVNSNFGNPRTLTLVDPLNLKLSYRSSRRPSTWEWTQPRRRFMSDTLCRYCHSSISSSVGTRSFLLCVYRLCLYGIYEK